jgi:hypothetical protein
MTVLQSDDILSTTTLLVQYIVDNNTWAQGRFKYSNRTSVQDDEVDGQSFHTVTSYCTQVLFVTSDVGSKQASHFFLGLSSSRALAKFVIEFSFFILFRFIFTCFLVFEPPPSASSVLQNCTTEPRVFVPDADCSGSLSP